MFAAICEKPEFFKERMNGFVAIAPIISLDNIKSDILKNLSSKEQLLQTIQNLRPEILTMAIAGNSFSKIVAKTDLANFTA